MKRLIDVKSLVIGVLATALFFTIVGAKSRNDANFNTITAKGIKIVNPEGKPIAILGSGLGGGTLDIYNRYGKEVATVQANKKSDGAIFIYNKEGKPVADLGSVGGKGRLYIHNKEGKVVTILGSNKDSDGAIYLFDRYGDLGWGMTGKR